MRHSHEFSVRRCPRLGIETVCAHSTRHFARHTHEQFGIGILTRGAQRSSSCAGQVEAQQGDVITVHPGEVHDGTPIGEAPRAWHMLYLDPAVVADIAADRTEGACVDYEFRSPVLRSPALYRRCQQLLKAASVEAPPPLGLETLLIDALTDAGRVARPAPAREEASPARAIRHAITLIQDDPTRSIGLAQLAYEAGLSRYQLIRGVRAATGLTPHAYLLQCRLDMARRLLRAGRSLSDTAYTCGFTDQSHLNRVFVGRFGLTPGAYAKAIA